MTFKVKVFTDPLDGTNGASLANGAKLAIAHRLYVSGWMLRYELDAMIMGRYRGKLALGFKGGIPIAIAVCNKDRQMMAFCRAAERGQGFASACVKAIRPRHTRVYAEEGLYGTWQFWNKNDIIVSSRRLT